MTQRKGLRRTLRPLGWTPQCVAIHSMDIVTPGEEQLGDNGEKQLNTVRHLRILSQWG